MIFFENFLVSFSKMDKVFLRRCHEAVSDYGLTKNEVMCLLFLQNNAPYDSPKDIAEFRRISKSLVAKSVDSLVSAGYLTTKKEENDRRVLHLHTTPACEPILAKLAKSRDEFRNALLEGVSPEEQAQLDIIRKKMSNNLGRMI
ncbi:MAG: MarR family transcriptional regulator [Erysipelotrichaceae bacterium]|nr:MarR family transcriptional regulator [Erysipelotrichaceae bacterium]MDD3810487.1 MarR family transcriptional regulator [Erysipelotrichaceae bacterium]